MPLAQKKRKDINPAVSVLMTVYNAGKFLKPAIDSLLAQTFTDFELIIIENGSIDGSREIIRSYDDSRLKIFELDENIGRTPALIKAFEKAKSEYIAIQDADDVSLPQRLELQADYMRNNPQVVLLGTSCKFIDQANQFLRKFNPPCNTDEAYQSLAFENIVAHSSAIYRRDAAEKVGGYPVELSFSQDYGLWLRLAKIGEIANLPQELVLIREHSGRITNSRTSLVSQSLDVIHCLDNARNLPKLSAESTRRIQHNKILELGRLSKSYFKTGNLLLGFLSAFRCFLRSPNLVIKKLFFNKNILN